MACDYESYLDRKKKNEVFAHYEYLHLCTFKRPFFI